MSNTRPEWYQLRDAIETADFSTASSILNKDPGLLHERNVLGETVLHYLAVENNQPAVEWLHTRGANLNSVNECGTPLLFEVAQLGYQDWFRWLVEHGADPGMKDAEGTGIMQFLEDFNEPGMLQFIKKHIAS